jgi:hypothetical protein
MGYDYLLTINYGKDLSPTSICYDTGRKVNEKIKQENLDTKTAR